MGIYSEYLDAGMSFDDLASERKVQLKRIEGVRGRDILVYAANLSVQVPAPISIEYADLLPFRDQLVNLSGEALDLLIETPGGSGEAAENLVKLVRGRYDDVAAIIPGAAMSAGTLMVMAADEILMDSASSLGPIDAQIGWQGKQFSAEALLDGINGIKDEVAATGALNLAYVPMLQQLSPGEIQNAQNALKFATELVTDWLVTYKFKNWVVHSSTGKPVTCQERQDRAREVALALRDHKRWLTHGRSLKIADLEAMRLQITDYSVHPDLHDAVSRYHTLLRMTFDSNVYKLFETPSSQIYKFTAVPQMATPAAAAAAQVGFECGSCKTNHILQVKFDPAAADDPGAIAWPADNKFACPSCSTIHDLSDMRRAIEAQVGRPVVT